MRSDLSELVAVASVVFQYIINLSPAKRKKKISEDYNCVLCLAMDEENELFWSFV